LHFKLIFAYLSITIIAYLRFGGIASLLID
jgi:hypothetical protein